MVYATSLAGMYAVGDVRANSVKRVASTVEEGSVVIPDVHRYLAGFESISAEHAQGGRGNIVVRKVLCAERGRLF